MTKQSRFQTLNLSSIGRIVVVACGMASIHCGGDAKPAPQMECQNFFSAMYQKAVDCNDAQSDLSGIWRASYTSFGMQIGLTLDLRANQTYALKEEVQHDVDNTTSHPGCHQVDTYDGTWRLSGTAVALPATSGSELLEQCKRASDDQLQRTLSDSELDQRTRDNLKGTYDPGTGKLALAVVIDAVLQKQ